MILEIAEQPTTSDLMHPMMRGGLTRVYGRGFSTAIVRTTSHLLAGQCQLIQPHELRTEAVIDRLTGRPVKATNDSLGVELPCVDLSQQFSADEIETLKQACDDAGGIAVFTNQRLEMTIHDLVRFGQQIADSDDTEIEPHSTVKGHRDAPEVLEIQREANAQVVFGENWHSDNSFLARTASYSILRGVVVPRLGVNDTLFSSTQDAYDALSPTMQGMLLELNAFHSANRAYGAGHSGNSRAAMEGTGMVMRTDANVLKEDVLQPVVVVHPRTGRRGLYVSPTFTTRIDGMHADESVSLLRFLYEWIARPEFCTRVSWRPNQVVMWDNRALAHKGLADDVSQPRVVQRVSIRGTAPVNYRGQSFSEKVKVQAAPPSLFDWAEGKLSQQQQQH